MTKNVINVQVVYALPENQRVISLSLPAGSTARQAVERSHILQQFAEINPATMGLGIFGKLISHDHTLEEGARIEVYRPLIIDPKQARRERAQRTRS